jgi:type II secretory pathway predicted ATPase ExeA
MQPQAMECPMPQPNDLRRSLLAGEARRLASSADTLSIVLSGHRKLKNDLRRPSIEEIGSRATIFEL